MPLLESHTHPLRALWQVTEDADQLLALLKRKEWYLPSLATVRHEGRKQEWLAARLLLKALIGEEHPISYHPNGAPYLKDSPYNISISHTKGYVALLLTEACPAGIDIEQRTPRAYRLRERFLSATELATLTPHQAELQSTLYWSAKEVLFKMLGADEVDFREHLHLEPSPLATAGQLLASESRTERRLRFNLSYEIRDTFVWVWGQGDSNPSGNHLDLLSQSL